MEILFLAIALTFVWHVVIVFSPIIIGSIFSDTFEGETISFVIGILGILFYKRLSDKFGIETSLWGLGISLIVILVWQFYLKYELEVLGQFENFSIFVKSTYSLFVVFLAVCLFY